MSSVVEQFFNLQVALDALPLLLKGLLMTLKLIAVIVPSATLLGLVFAAVLSSKIPIITPIMYGCIDVLRAIPPLVLLIFVFYGLPFFGLKMSEYWSTVVALVLNGASYYAEIFRAGIESVPRGQTEAARSTGLSGWQALLLVVVPQATKNTLPDLVTNSLELSKQTSIASAVAVQELLRSGQIAQNIMFNPTPLVVVALMYFILLWPLVRLTSRLEHGMRVSR